MAERKKMMKGGLDPSEMARRGHEARRARKEAAERAAKEPPVPVADLPREKLIEVLKDPRTRPSDLVQAAKALSAIPADDDSVGWKASVQVRPDFEPPSWREVLMVAGAAGALK